MKSLSFEQMSQVEGGSSRLCKSALVLLALADALGSYLLFILALAAASRYCGGGGGGDSTPI